jgi:hypothetical protein
MLFLQIKYVSETSYVVEQNHGNRQRTDEQLNEHQSPETK